MTAGELIKSKREELGMTQEELSKKCGFKSRSSVNKIERISRGIPLKRVKAIADILGLDISEIVEMSLEEQKRNDMYAKYAEIRDAKGFTNSRVSVEADVSKSTFSDWKSGRSTPKYDKLSRIAKVLECSVEDFIEENDKSEKPEITHENTSESKNCITETSYVTDMLNVLSGIRDELHAIRECMESGKHIKVDGSSISRLFQEHVKEHPIKIEPTNDN